MYPKAKKQYCAIRHPFKWRQEIEDLGLDQEEKVIAIIENALSEQLPIGLSYVPGKQGKIIVPSKIGKRNYGEMAVFNSMANFRKYLQRTRDYFETIHGVIPEWMAEENMSIYRIFYESYFYKK